MNRKQRIIVSITGIFLVLLILVGLSYGYFLTRINGNDNEKSISVTTANLELTYNDNKSIINGNNIIPGETLSTKTFTVENTGNADIDSYNVGLVNIVNTLSRTDDLVYSITCISNISNKKCNGVNEISFPKENSIVLNNQINVDEIQTYTLKLDYKEMNEDQSIDMGKEFSGKIDIFGGETLTIEGNVTNFNDNDYVVINSKEQTSEIVDGKYKFVGIEPDNHTISIKNKNSTTIKKTTLNVEKGDTASVSNDKIIYDKEKNIASVDISLSGSTVKLNITKISLDDPTPPNDASIVINENFPQIISKLKATITQSDEISQIDVVNSKWLINKESGKLKDKMGYNWNSFTNNPEVVDISQTEPGIYYLHVVSVDFNGNEKETIKLVNILPEYDSSKNDTTVVTESGQIWTEGEGTSDKPYLISSINNLRYLSYKVNSGNKYTNVYFALKNDISLKEGLLLEKPIGYNTLNYFDGIFDGKGYKIESSGGSAISEFANFSGLFGVTGPNSEIKNLTIAYAEILGSNYVGIVGYNMGKVDKLIIQSSTINCDKYYCGGIVGCNNGEIKNVEIDSITINGNSYMGGIAGMNIGTITKNSVIKYSTFSLLGSYGGVISGYNKGVIEGINVSSNKTSGFTGLVGANDGTINS